MSIKMSDSQKRRWRKEKSMMRARICESEDIQALIARIGIKKWLYWKKKRVVRNVSPRYTMAGISTSSDDWYDGNL